MTLDETLPAAPTGASYAETASVTCPSCGRAFTPEVWLIVDAAARPDLLERIRAGTLHDIACPGCGVEIARADAPLLLYRPGAEPAILFSPAQGTSKEQDREQAAGLVNLLRERLGDAWDAGWTAEGLSAVPRQMLPTLLSDDPETALREMAEQAHAEMERLRREDPEAYRELEEAAQKALGGQPPPGASPSQGEGTGKGLSVLAALDQLTRAKTWPDSQRVVEANPDLLTDEADALLGQAIAAAQAQGDADGVAFYQEHRDLVRRCREAGIPRAFAEKMLPPEVLARAESAGISPEQALEIVRAADQMPPELRELLEQLASEGVEVRSQQDLERALAERPDLRARLAAAVGTTRRDLGDVPPELAPILEELSKPVRRTDMPRRVQLCREARAIASN